MLRGTKQNQQTSTTTSSVFIVGDSLVKNVNGFQLSGKVTYKCIIKVCQFLERKHLA